MTKNVMACIDGSSSSPIVCDYAAWASVRMSAPLVFLHVLDKSEYPVKSNLSGNIGLGSRETLLKELAELDEKRGKLAMEQGRLMLEAAHSHDRVILDEPPNLPKVFLKEFADNGILLELAVWIRDPSEGQNNLRSDLNWAIWRRFKAAGIEIPFPQRVVHLAQLPPHENNP